MQPLLSVVNIFVEAATAGGFSAAARNLNLSRSAVGKAIARMERQLGARLFHRTTRFVKLTDEGELFYEHCLRALAEVKAARTMLEAGRQEAVGRLKVTLPLVLGKRRIAPILTGLLQTHPRLELDLRFTDRVVDLVGEGFDLAVRTGPLFNSDGLTARRIGEERMMLCASPEYLASHGTPAVLADLGAHQAVTYASRRRDSRWLLAGEAGGWIEFVPLSRLRLDDLDAVAAAAENGLGVAWLPDSLVAERLASGRLIQILTQVPSFVVETYAVWPTTPRLPVRTRVAIDALAGRGGRTTSSPWMVHRRSITHDG